jgi:hypothetical protein
MRTADIQQGIIDALAAAFPGVTIYAEKVPQNFDEPSFRVKSITATNRPELDTRRWREVQFDILYFPESGDEPEAEWRDVCDDLFNTVEWITAAGDTMRGTELAGDFDTEQEVGHFRVTFGAFLMDVHEPGPTMETLTQTGGANNG